MTPPTTLTFAAQVRHQLHREWQHHRLWALALLAFIVLRLAYLVDPFWQAYAGYRGEPYWLQFMNIFVPAALFMRVILAEPLASTDLGTLTRPLSRWALVLGKGLFLSLAALLPWLLADAWLWRGFDHSVGTWVALLLGSAQGMLVTALLFAALASLATSVAQLTLLLLGFVVLYFGLDIAFSQLRELLGWQQVNREVPPFGEASALLNSLAYVVPSLFFLAVFLVQAVGRRRGLAGALLVLGITLVMGGSHFWQWLSWLRLPLPAYTGNALTLVVGPSPAIADEALRMQPLWPTLHVSGLPPRHMAMVVHFAPAGLDMNQARLHWRKGEGPFYWMDDNIKLREFDRAKILLGQYPDTDLSFTSDFSGPPPMRAPLNKVLGPTLPSQPWQLRLAVYEMRQLLDLPLADFLKAPPPFLLKSGRRLEFQPLKEGRGAYILPWTVRLQNSRLLPDPLLQMDDIPRFADGGVGGAWAVLRDGSVRENNLISRQSGNENILRSGQFHEDTTYSWEFHLDKPLDRLALTGLTLDTWIKDVRVEIWVPELRGITDLEVSPEMMRQMTGRADRR
jgi:hypothetical protein